MQLEPALQMLKTASSAGEMRTPMDATNMKNRVTETKYLPEPEVSEPPGDGQFVLALCASMLGLLAMATALLAVLLFL